METPENASALPDEEEFIIGANKAIERAIKASHAAGIPTTHGRNGKLVQVNPDGTSQEIGILRPL